MRDSIPVDTDMPSWFWIVPLLFGIVVVVIGLVVLLNPVSSAVVIVQLVGLSWVIGGVVNIIMAAVHRDENWGWMIVGGLIVILTGAFALASPAIAAQITLVLLFWMVIVGAFVSGVMDLVRGLRSSTRSWWAVGLGVAKIVIGLLLVAHPIAGALLPLPILGLALMVTGVLAGVFAFEMRRDLKAQRG
jgi:uncharacterized membrane protein HdeD (DUF308 family)